MISATPLTSGKLWTKAARLSRGSEFNVEASGAVAGVRGTEFDLSVIPAEAGISPGVSLTVLSGKVALSPSATALAAAKAGSATGPSGAELRSFLPTAI